MKFTVKRATIEHALECNDIARLSKYTRGFHKPSRFYQDKRSLAFGTLDEPSHVWVAVKYNSEYVLGFAWCVPMKPRHMPYSMLYDMGVRPEARGHGVGKALLKELKRCAKERTVRLLCEDRNTEGMAFYKAVGCRVVGKGNVGGKPTGAAYTRWEY